MDSPKHHTHVNDIKGYANRVAQLCEGRAIPHLHVGMPERVRSDTEWLERAHWILEVDWHPIRRILEKRSPQKIPTLGKMRDDILALMGQWPFGGVKHLEPQNGQIVPDKYLASAIALFIDELLYEAQELEAVERKAAESKGRRPGKGGGKDNRQRKARRRTAAARPLTTLQTRALELYGTCNGKIGEIASKMGISHATVNQHLKAAWRKLPQLAPKKTAPAGRTTRLPTDHRGQVDVPAKNEDEEYTDDVSETL